MENNLAIVPYVPQPSTEKFLLSFALREAEIDTGNTAIENHYEKIKEDLDNILYSRINRLKYLIEEPEIVSSHFSSHSFRAGQMANSIFRMAFRFNDNDYVPNIVGTSLTCLISSILNHLSDLTNLKLDSNFIWGEKKSTKEIQIWSVNDADEESTQRTLCSWSNSLNCCSNMLSASSYISSDMIFSEIENISWNNISFDAISFLNVNNIRKPSQETKESPFLILFNSSLYSWSNRSLRSVIQDKPIVISLGLCSPFINIRTTDLVWWGSSKSGAELDFVVDTFPDSSSDIIRWKGSDFTESTIRWGMNSSFALSSVGWEPHIWGPHTTDYKEKN